MSIGIAAGALSMVFFLLLAAGVPFVGIVPVVGIALWAYWKYGVAATMKWVEDDGSRPFFSLIILAVGMATMVAKSYPLTERYGGWDAWAIWNLQAKYLASDTWRTLFLNVRHGHPDYPLLVPGITAFFARILPMCRIEAIAFVPAFCFMLFIPVLIYLQYAGRSIIVATYVLFMLATDKFFLTLGVSMYADTALAFFFLCALAAMKQQLAGNRQVAIAAAALGCAMWTKNEGVVLSAIFCLFYFRELFLGGRYKYFAAAIALPVLTLVVFKLGFAPANDMAHGLSGDTWHHLTDMERYRQIFTSFSDNIEKNFGYIRMGVLLYGIVCLWRRQWPGKDMLMIVCCVAAYFMIYVVSFMDLQWHLLTSADRLLHQLMPALVFVIADKLAGNGNRMSFVIRRG
ncbi:hypothetical protein [Nemorincola caseinilytica]